MLPLHMKRVVIIACLLAPLPALDAYRYCREIRVQWAVNPESSGTAAVLFALRGVFLL